MIPLEKWKFSLCFEIYECKIDEFIIQFDAHRDFLWIYLIKEEIFIDGIDVPQNNCDVNYIDDREDIDIFYLVMISRKSREKIKKNFLGYAKRLKDHFAPLRRNVIEEKNGEKKRAFLDAFSQFSRSTANFPEELVATIESLPVNPRE